MPAQQAKPLPECRRCEQPMVRKVHADHGGLCRSCRFEIDVQEALRRFR